MYPENIGLISEGVIQLSLVVIIIATLYRRGGNPYLKVLGFFFLFFGLFSLMIAFLANEKTGIEILTSSSFINSLTHEVTYMDLLMHEVTYYGVVGYLVFQLAMIYGQKVLRWPFFGLFMIATILSVVNSYHLPIWNLSVKNKIFFSTLSQWLEIWFFVLAIIAVVVILLFLLGQLKKIKNRMPLNYVSTTCTGIGVIVAALLSLKALHPFIGDPVVDLIIFFTYGLVFGGFVAQFSLISLPGIIYNYETRLPVPLATIRITDKISGRLVESRVTEKDGRYEVLLEAGIYTFAVGASGYKFPSKKIKGYHGEEIKIKNPRLISLDIPLEPIKK